MKLFRRKNVAQLQDEAQSDQRLNRALGPMNLTLLGIGAIIGTGIFVLTGTVAARNAGPAVVLSFILAGLASVFAALCYSEFASLVPLSGSAYTYGYATLGEFFAWVIGWDLILEYAVGAITVAIGWSGYMVSFLRDISALLAKWGIPISLNVPPQFSAASGTPLVDIPASLAAPLHLVPGWQELNEILKQQIVASGASLASLPQTVAVFNLPAVLIIAVVTTLLVVGVKESARFNNIIVFIKLAVIGLFIVGVARAVNSANWQPFIPVNSGTFGQFGWSGITMGAGIVFFAYIGFDAVSTAAQEARNPQRNMPIGIIGSLVVCTVLYIVVSALATGVVPYQLLDVPDPIAKVADHAGLKWMGLLIKMGAIAGLSSVILVMLYGQSRVFWSMSRDGLLPAFAHRVHPRFRTPWITSIVTGVVVAFFSAVFTVREAGSLCSIGTLLAFVIVSVGILFLRVRQPEMRAAFRTPVVWLVAPLGALSALTLMLSLPWLTWERLIIWFAIGMIVYFGFGIYNSKLGPEQIPGETRWSRALKVAGLVWIVGGSLVSVLWLFRYRETFLPGPWGWVVGVAGLLVTLSFGMLLSLLAQLCDHMRATSHEGGAP
jgi:basic amino acid/polyamine antiporter, APA family